MQEALSMRINTGQAAHIQPELNQLYPIPTRIIIDNEDNTVSEYLQLTADQLINIIKKSPEKTAQVLDAISGQIRADLSVLKTFFKSVDMVSNTTYKPRQREKLRGKLLNNIKYLSANLDNLAQGVKVANDFLTKYTLYLEGDLAKNASAASDVELNQQLQELDKAFAEVKSLEPDMDNLNQRFENISLQLQNPIQ